MTGKTVTRADIGEAVYQEIGLSRNESADLLESVLEYMADALIKGETVKVSSFGSFPFAKKASGSVEIRRLVKKCRSCHARFWCFVHHKFSKAASTKFANPAKIRQTK